MGWAAGMSAGVLAVIILGPAGAAGAEPTSAAGTAAVRVVAAVSVTESRSLDFGVRTSRGAGVTAIDPSGHLSVSGGVGVVAGGEGHAGAFDIEGDANAAISARVSPAIHGFKGGITGATWTQALPGALAGTSALFSVGGVLHIPANTPSGAYSGAYAVMVNYP